MLLIPRIWENNDLKVPERMALRELKVEVIKYLDLCLGKVGKVVLRTSNIRKLDLLQ